MRMLRGLLITVLVAAAAYFAFAWIWGVPHVEDHATLTDEASIARGKYLVIVGDCASCHDAPGGAALAGGYGLATPMGEIVGTNITPSASGIGGMSSADFYRLIAYGADNIWRPLYPAMPYTSFHLVTRDDSDALHAYLMSLPPVENAPVKTSLMFPFNVRPGVFAWNLLFAGREPFKPRADRDAVWNRGAYLVEGLAHCGACHTPRNIFYAEKAGEALKGGKLGSMEATDITADGLLARRWTFDQLVSYLATGNGPHGSSFGEMDTVIRRSTSLMTQDDRVAIATYLFDGKSSAAAPAATPVAASGTASEGQSLYLGNCAICHKANGEGIPNTTPTLAGNSSVGEPNGRNLVVVTADGLKQSQIVPGTGLASLGPMPAFRNRLTPTQMTALVNYVRKAFGDAAMQDLSEDQVKALLDGK